MRSEGFFTYSRGAYTNFPHEERKIRSLSPAERTVRTLRAVWRKLVYAPRK